MNAQTQNLDLERLLAILRRRWWVIALLALLVAGSAFVVLRAPGQEIHRQSVSAVSDSAAQPAGGRPADRVLCFVQCEPGCHGYQRAAADAAIRRRGQNGPDRRPWSDSPGAFPLPINVSEQGQTNIALVSATSPSPSLAAAIANTSRPSSSPASGASRKRPSGKDSRSCRNRLERLSRQQIAGPSGQALLDRAESLRILAKLQNGGVQLRLFGHAAELTLLAPGEAQHRPRTAPWLGARPRRRVSARTLRSPDQKHRRTRRGVSAAAPGRGSPEQVLRASTTNRFSDPPRRC